MKKTSDDIKALCGSILVFLLLFLLLWYGYLRTIVPAEDSGILVNFGDIYASSGITEPQIATSTPEPEIVPPPPAEPVKPVVEEELIKQEEEETVVIPEKKPKEEVKKKPAEVKPKPKPKPTEKPKATEKPKPNPDDEAKKREAAEAEKRRKQQQQQEDNINRVADNAFGPGSTTASQQGDKSSPTGNQGNPFGNTNTGSTATIGGYGSFNLDGRSIGGGGLPRPAYVSGDEGKIVINITVDPAGNVINAEIGRGTTIDNASQRQNALQAARRAKFNSIKSANNQNGTIIYRYRFTD
ncbi:MAG: TonB family protein [Tannerella sp.]|jgi:TonB family protein|nr:TonB family protein [Tannerella sp.]